MKKVANSIYHFFLNRQISHVWRQPEGPCFPYFFQGRKKFCKVFTLSDKIVGIKASFKKLNGKQFVQPFQGYNSIPGFRVKPGPVCQVFFRPEEMHGTSGKWHFGHPFGKGNRYMPHNAVGVGVQYFSIFHFDLNGFATIQAWRINLNCFTGIQPADRQRFKSSLAVPFLLAVNGDPILGRQVVERCKGYDQIRFRI